MGVGGAGGSAAAVLEPEVGSGVVLPGSGGGAAASKALRREAGRWLKRLREAAGLTQADVAQRLGLRYYTFVSQVEGGHGRVPSDQVAGWADALGVSRRLFARELLRWYEPDLHRLLFEADPAADAGRDPAVVLFDFEMSVPPAHAHRRGSGGGGGERARG